MNGSKFKRIRTRAGYTAEEFGRYIARSGRTVYRLEELMEVKGRYVDALRQFIGKEMFDRYSTEYDEERERYRRRAEEARARRVAEEAATYMGQKYGQAK